MKHGGIGINCKKDNSFAEGESFSYVLLVMAEN
jgi:hypothetical protein